MQYKHYLNNFSIFLLFGFLATCSLNLVAWNFQGHQLISEIAYTELSKPEQKKLDKILDELIIQLPPKYKKIFKDEPYALSKLAKLSIMPDLWKNYNLDQLCKTLNITDQTITNNIPNKKTHDWHYKSVLLKDQDIKTNIKINTLLADGKIDAIINLLLTNIQNTKNKSSRAFGIIFLAHLLQDAHQPLHAMSKQLGDDQDSYDKGGNLFCLRAKNNTCTYNLHQYWDNAGGLLASKDIKLLASNVHLEYPKSNFHTKLKENNPIVWLQESFEYKAVVYNTVQNHMPNKLYQAKVRTITSERMALAAYRLNNLLKASIS